MNIKRLEFILEAVEPIAHHAETFGNEAVIQRRDLRLPGGAWVSIPEITGDTMRHGLREASAYAMLDAADLLRDVSPALSEGALRLLFAGGMVTGKGASPTINLDTYRRMCDLMPALKLLGGCADNRVIPGTTTAESALLICDETRPLLARTMPWVVTWLADHAETTSTSRLHVDEEQRVRMDPTLVPEKVSLLSESGQVAVNRRLAGSEVAHAADDAVDGERTKSSMLPRRYEVVKMGSLFSWGVEARCYSALDEDAFMVMVLGFLARARVGGKKATGHGRLVPVACQAIEVMRPAERSTAVVIETERAKIGRLFYEHVKARKEQVAEMLRTVIA